MKLPVNGRLLPWLSWIIQSHSFCETVMDWWACLRGDFQPSTENGNRWWKWHVHRYYNMTVPWKCGLCWTVQLPCEHWKPPPGTVNPTITVWNTQRLWTCDENSHRWSILEDILCNQDHVNSSGQGSNTPPHSPQKAFTNAPEASKKHSLSQISEVPGMNSITLRGENTSVWTVRRPPDSHGPSSSCSSLLSWHR